MYVVAWNGTYTSRFVVVGLISVKRQNRWGSFLAVTGLLRCTGLFLTEDEARVSSYLVGFIRRLVLLVIE